MPGSDLDTIRERAERGDPEAMLALARAFEEGGPVLQDFAEAVRWYERAAEQGHGAACSMLGEIFLVGRGAETGDDRNASGVAKLLRALSVPVDYAKAAHWNRLAAEAGDTAAQTRLAAQYAYGLGMDQDWQAAQRLFLMAAEQGDAIAQRGLGMLHAGGELGPPDYALAAYWLRQAARQKDIAASAALAFLIGQGHVDALDEAELLSSLSQAAEAGHVEAMAALGTFYRRGLAGMAADPSVAETWYRRASIRGHLGATLALGFLLIEDLSPPDYFSAALVFREASDRGNATARYVLGMFYLNGLGVPQDRAKAEALLASAADEGLASALEALATLKAPTAEGQDASEAIGLLDRAIAAGSIEALYRRAHLTLYDPAHAASESGAAVAMLREAAERGSAAAALQMGVLCAKGELIVRDYAEASRWYRAAAERGLSDGLVNLAFLRLTGIERNDDGQSGIAMLEEAAGQGNRNAMWALYNVFNDGAYVAADPDQALKWLVAATRHGSGAAAGRLVEQWQAGRATGISEPELLEYLKGAADLGDPEAEAVYGRLLYEGEQDREEAFRRLNSAAQNGSLFAQAWMGDVLMRGESVLKDEALARDWYRKAARGGHIGAALALSRDIMGADPDEAEKADLFALWLPLAEAGDVTAQRMIGDFFLQGYGVEASDAQAEHWLRMAADSNQLGALLLLGGMLVSGRVRASTPDEAVRLFERAAAQGSVEADFNLGVCFRHGLGMAADGEKARMHFRRAAVAGHEPAKAALLEFAGEERVR